MEIISVGKTHTVYREGDRAIKVYNADYPKGGVFAEALNQARIEEIGLNAPKVYGVHERDGKWAIEMQYIAGENLQKLIDENPGKEDEYLRLFVNLHMGIYAYKLPTLFRLIDKANAEIKKTTLRATVKYDLHTKLDDHRKHTRICHGDFVPQNVIATDDGRYYVLDWSNTTQGNPPIDIATTYLLLKLDKRESFAEKYLDMMGERSKYGKDEILSWLIVAAVQRLAVCPADEREFLLDIIGAKDCR